jgi:peptidoglycan hydrolase CwlO-like protein
MKSIFFLSFFTFGILTALYLITNVSSPTTVIKQAANALNKSTQTTLKTYNAVEDRVRESVSALDDQQESVKEMIKEQKEKIEEMKKDLKESVKNNLNTND